MSIINILDNLSDKLKARQETKQWKNQLKHQPSEAVAYIARLYNLKYQTVRPIIIGHVDGRYDLSRPDALLAVDDALADLEIAGDEAQHQAIRNLTEKTLPFSQKRGLMSR